MTQQVAQLRILMVTNNYRPYSGGVVSSIDATTDELRSQGHQVTIVTLDFVSDNSKTPEDIARPDVIRLFCPVKFRYKKNHMAIPWRAYKQLEDIIHTSNPTVIHVHHPFLLGKWAAQLARAHHIPVVFTYHTLYEHYVHYVPLPAKLVALFIAQSVHNFCNSIDGIIVPSRWVHTKLIESKIVTPVRVIPSGLQKHFMQRKFLKKRALSTHIDLLYVGRFTQEKNVTFILDAYAHFIKNTQNKYTSRKYTSRLLLAGYGAEYEQLRTYAYDILQLSDEQIQFSLKPKKEQLIAYYQQAHFLLFSSVSDSQGLVIAEAMAAGTPVISVNGPGQSDSIEHNKNGFFVDTPEQMAQMILEGIIDTERYEQLQKGAWETAQRYSISSTTSELISFYQKFIPINKKSHQNLK